MQRAHVMLGVATVAVLTAAGAMRPGRLPAQQLVPKGAIASTGPSGCAAYATVSPPGVGAPTDDPEARRLISDAQEAALQGEHAAARDAFAKAAQRAPANARIAYYLGREHEALAESTDAVRQYCRYLALSPNATDGDEVRGRIVRLVPTSELSRVDEAKANFRSGVALLERRQYVAADSVFGAIIRQLPTAAEAYYDRGLARAARGARGPAQEDFEKYLELSPSAPDRLTLRAAMARFPDRVYAPGEALVSGIIPGMGQMSTGRPLLGVAVLGAVGGALGFGMAQKETIQVRTFTDPFGNTYTDSLPRTSRPNLMAAAITAGVLWIGAAVEAQVFARRSHARAESIMLRPGDRRPASKRAPRPASEPAASSSLQVAFAGGWPGNGMKVGLSMPFGGRTVPR